MDRVLSSSEMREADAYTINVLGANSADLMQKAGVALADEAEKTAKTLKTDEITVVCGTGNNGGDGYVCATELLNRGFNVAVYAVDSNLSPDCQLKKSAYKGRYLRHITGAIVIDCLFGTGLSREVTGEYAQIINEINESSAFVISADIASGLNGDNGLVMGCAVKADKTVAIAEYKLGHFLNDGIDLSGEVIKKDIGIACPDKDYVVIYSADDVVPFYPKRKRNSHKGTYGTANLIAGCEKYTGSAVLAVSSALSSGCGLVKLTSEKSVRLALCTKFPQAIYLEEADLSAQSITIGMGCGVSRELYERISRILREYTGELVIDADGLNTISKFGIDILKRAKCNVTVTPHIKEFSRLTGLSVNEILQDPVTHAKNFALKHGVTVVLKSAVTIITDGQKVALNTRGSTALSKGGSGDVLAGYICGCLARGINSFNSAVCATFVLGVSAEISSKEKTDYCATAKDVLKNLHFSIRNLTRQN